MNLFLESRPDFTFKFNKSLGRHGWLRLTPTYSVKIVHQCLNNARPKYLVLDPFSGTATTALVSTEKGLQNVSLDINPFLVWLGTAKYRHYSQSEIASLKRKVDSILQQINYDNREYWIPPIHNIERWWDPFTLQLLAKFRYLLAETLGEPGQNPVADLAWAAFCRLVNETSSATFNHVSMSFKNGTRQFDSSLIVLFYENIFQYVCNSASQALSGKALILEQDARNMDVPTKFDIVVTSPPYPNRISYIRELRPYMYWTQFLHNGNDAGELDWKAIGGTWGIATSRLKKWAPAQPRFSDNLMETCPKIASNENANAGLMATYVHKFFDDFHTHLASLRNYMRDGGQIHYILGNSSFYGFFVETDLFVKEIPEQLGYKEIEVMPLRKRNSKKGLIEFCISAKWST